VCQLGKGRSLASKISWSATHGNTQDAAVDLATSFTSSVLPSHLIWLLIERRLGKMMISMTYSVDSITIQNDISPLYTQYEPFAFVTVE
jgi:hypothetical protein